MNGVLNIFKPKGMSSFDAVRVVKKVAGTGKVGHTGTLDPEATGVLPICIGRATKIIDYIMDSEKVYEVTLKLGIRTTTYDLEGEVLEERDPSHLTEEEILNSINSFKGEYSQIPPMYSALKQNGVRLYELARKGIEVERKGRLINIHNLEDVKINNPYISMKVTCSKGTYIRSLCYDIGEKLGVFATMTQLNRAKTSVFSQEKSININELTKENINDYILSMEEALEKYDKIVVNKKYVKLLVNGVRVADGRFTKDKVINNKLYRVYDDENNFIGLGERNDAGFKIEKLLIT
ncbi:tRNA pseudouridine(55) synthase TruB [uncultured Clostridium sp.]|uniref:tRNA pseudouridine(55) synthase TruB n=1 Tax=uncultured Clostridium sp. TaxID=59620 RepID=UPI00266F13C9|nr:tRNA pseudouridine(55) synthase TruB [uncultured Clostridium sp.]